MGSNLEGVWAKAAAAPGSSAVVMGGRARMKAAGQTCQGDPGERSRRGQGAQFTGRPLRLEWGWGWRAGAGAGTAEGVVPTEAWGQVRRGQVRQNPGMEVPACSRARSDRRAAG